MKEKLKQAFLYLFFGGLSFGLNLLIFFLLTHNTNVGVLISNFISWILCVLFQFFTNRKWVFEMDNGNVSVFFHQASRFVGGRIFTLALEEILLLVFITWLGFEDIIVKLLSQFVVIVLNFLISKFWVFNSQQRVTSYN